MIKGEKMEVIFREFILFLFGAVIYSIATALSLNLKKRGLFLFLTSITIPILTITFRFFFRFSSYIYAPLICAILLFMLIFFSKENKKTTFLYFMIHNIIMVFSEYISAALVFFALDIKENYTYEMVIKNIIPFRTTYYLIYVLNIIIFVFIWNNLTAWITKDSAVLYGFAPIIFSQIGFLCTLTELLQEDVSHSANWHIKIFLFGILFATAQISIILALKIQEKRLKKQSRQETLLHLIKTQFDQFKQMILQEKRKAKFNHDLNNQLETISALYSLGDHEGALKYLQKLLNMVEIQQQETFCTNPALNALLFQKKTICDLESLKLDASVALGSNFSMDEMTLCSIFGNILDNAIQACKGYNGASERKIILRANHIHRFFLITCDNPISEQRFEDSERNHWGLEILSDIAAQYNGSLSAKKENGHFVLELNIQIY